MCCFSFTADRGAHFFTPADTGKSHDFHQPGYRASGHADVFPEQLTPDLANAIHTVVFIIHARYLRFQKVVTLFPLTASGYRLSCCCR